MKQDTARVLIICPKCKGNRTVEVTTHISMVDGLPDGYREECGYCEGDGHVVDVFIDGEWSHHEHPTPADKR